MSESRFWHTPCSFSPFIITHFMLINAYLRRPLVLGAVLLTALNAFGWGQKGHDVTAAIAERHLTPAARAAVDSLLEGRSMIYWSNWLDNASHTPEYAYSKTWHYKNVNPDERYEEAYANPAGDVVTAIKSRIEILTDTAAAVPAKAEALKMLVHLVGDMHQPLHMGRSADLGGNRIKVRYFGREQNLHSVWDSALPESAHKWSYTEWADQIDRAALREQRAAVAGSIDDWAKQTIEIANAVYEHTPAGASMSYDEVAQWTPVIERQFLAGGLRLAALLNTIFK